MSSIIWMIFFLVGAPASPECAGALTTLLSVFDWLGLPVATEKLEGPWCRHTFLRLELDSTALIIRVPPRKLTELQHLIHSWIGRKGFTKKELESLVGNLAMLVGWCHRQDFHEVDV